MRFALLGLRALRLRTLRTARGHFRRSCSAQEGKGQLESSAAQQALLTWLNLRLGYG
jgi:hypothetical protein